MMGQRLLSSCLCQLWTPVQVKVAASHPVTLPPAAAGRPSSPTVVPCTHRINAESTAPGGPHHVSCGARGMSGAGGGGTSSSHLLSLPQPHLSSHTLCHRCGGHQRQQSICSGLGAMGGKLFAAN